MMKSRRSMMNITTIVDIRKVIIFLNILMIYHLIKQLKLMKRAKMHSRIIQGINRLIKTITMMVTISNKNTIIRSIRDKLSINQWHFIIAKSINKMNQARMITVKICIFMKYQCKWIWVAKNIQFLSKGQLKIRN